MQVFFTDDCCAQRAMLDDVFAEHFLRTEPTVVVPRVRNDAYNLKFLQQQQHRYEGIALTYVSSIDTAAQLCSKLHDQLQLAAPASRVLGFDMEWSPGAAAREIGFIQLATSNELLLLQVSGWSARKLPAALCLLLQDASILKVGNNILADKTRLSAWTNGSFPQQPSPDWINLSQEAKDVGLVERAQISLDALVLRVLSVTLPKPANLRTTTWSAPAFKPSPDALAYAACDAIASLEVFLALQKLKTYGM